MICAKNDVQFKCQKGKIRRKIIKQKIKQKTKNKKKQKEKNYSEVFCLFINIKKKNIMLKNSYLQLKKIVKQNK